MNRPQLVLLHGWGLGQAVWSPCLPALAETVSPHLADLPGYGEVPNNGKTFKEAAQALADNLPPGATLCGWSLGAQLALQAAHLAPTRVGRLILVGATPCFAQRDDWPEAQPPALLDDFATAVAADAKATLQRFVAVANQGDAKARGIGREIARTVFTAPLPSTATLLAGLAWLRDIDLRDIVTEITCPVLLLHGENDPLMPLAAARWLATHLPQASLDVFPGAAHAPFLNDPERFARRIGAFLHAPEFA